MQIQKSRPAAYVQHLGTLNKGNMDLLYKNRFYDENSIFLINFVQKIKWAPFPQAKCHAMGRNWATRKFLVTSSQMEAQILKIPPMLSHWNSSLAAVQASRLTRLVFQVKVKSFHL